VPFGLMRVSLARLGRRILPIDQAPSPD